MRYKFPDPNERSPKHPSVLCTAERVLELYNQDSGQQAQRISKAVRTWFFEQAHAIGWDGVNFIPEVQSKHGAGCVLWKKFEGSPAVPMTPTTIFLADSDK